MEWGTPLSRQKLRIVQGPGHVLTNQRQAAAISTVNAGESLRVQPHSMPAIVNARNTEGTYR